MHENEAWKLLSIFSLMYLLIISKSLQKTIVTLQ